MSMSIFMKTLATWWAVPDGELIGRLVPHPVRCTFDGASAQQWANSKTGIGLTSSHVQYTPSPKVEQT